MQNQPGASGDASASSSGDRPGVAPPPGSATTAEAGLIALVLIWGVNFSAIKAALGELDPLSFNAVRFPLASLLLYTLLRARGPIPLPRRRDWPRLVLLGLLGHVVYQLFFIYGIDATRAGNAALLLASTPIWTMLLSVRLGHERLPAPVWVGVLATIAGMVLVVVGSEAVVNVGESTLSGDLIMVAASVAWSAYTVGAREPIQRYGSLAVTGWTLWIGTAGLVIIGGYPLTRTSLADVSGVAWASTAYAGLLGIGAAYALWYLGVRRLGNTRTAVHANLVPVVALGVAWLWLGERPTAVQLAGAAVIIGGVTLTRLRGSSGDRPDPDPPPRRSPRSDGGA